MKFNWFFPFYIYLFPFVFILKGLKIEFNPEVSARAVFEAGAIVAGQTCFYNKREFCAVVTAFGKKREFIKRIRINMKIASEVSG